MLLLCKGTKKRGFPRTGAPNYECYLMVTSRCLSERCFGIRYFKDFRHYFFSFAPWKSLSLNYT